MSKKRGPGLVGQAMKKSTTSWKTSATGLLAIIAAVANALMATLDTDPATIPDWGLAISSAMAGLGLMAARDNNVTSEDAGAK